MRRREVRIAVVLDDVQVVHLRQLEQPEPLVFCLLAIADVTNEADEELVAELLACGDGQLDWKFVAVAMQSGDLDPLIENGNRRAELARQNALLRRARSS